MRGTSDGRGWSGRDTVVLATTLYGLLSVLFMLVAAASLVNALTARSLICAYSQGDPHCVRNAWVWAFFALALAVTSTYTIARLKGERRGQRRRAWWAGIVAGMLVALPGVVVVLSPIWSHNTGLTEMLPELVGGLLIMAVAGVLIGSLLAPTTGRWVRGEADVEEAAAAADEPGGREGGS